MASGGNSEPKAQEWLSSKDWSIVLNLMIDCCVLIVDYEQEATKVGNSKFGYKILLTYS